MTIPTVPLDPNLDAGAKASAERYIKASLALTDRSSWPLKMFTSLNLFLWHLDAFEVSDADPVPPFIEAFNNAAAILEAAQLNVVGGHFPNDDPNTLALDTFEDQVSGLFSDIWVDMTDDIYFDQSYEFTEVRFKKSGFDPVEFFKDKVVVDGGCGSGKFSAAIGRFGAKKVIGVDIGKKGLDFARKQAKKVPYGKNLEYVYGSLLNIPLEDNSADVVWSNGVIHHTLGYEKCVEEFARILKPGGQLFLYVNGRFGLFELLQDTLRLANVDIPKPLFQAFLRMLGCNSGRIYWAMDCLFAPYEWKSAKDLEALLKSKGFTDMRQLTRGVDIDQIEQISQGIPYAEVKYGEGQLKYICRYAG